MRFSVAFAAVLAASVEASGRQRRQWGYPDVEDCGLDGFEGHTSEAALFCSNILRSGTATATVTNGYTTTTTTTRKTYTNARTDANIEVNIFISSFATVVVFIAQAIISFGYGEANCMLFDVTAAENTNYNPMSPYTFYDAACPAELPVRKRQLDISLGLPGGIHISLGLGPGEISSACSCFITKGPASTTVTRTIHKLLAPSPNHHQDPITMAHFSQITNLAEYVACIKATAGKTVLLAYWPEDETTNEVATALQKLLPSTSYEQYDVVDIYCFDMYSLPELGNMLDVSFVPTLMWFMDGVMDAIVWHEGCAIEGESVEKGVKRVVDRIKGGDIAGEDSDDDW
ncbi:unnamed protein product [Alternaria alternata]